MYFSPWLIRLLWRPSPGRISRSPDWPAIRSASSCSGCARFRRACSRRCWSHRHCRNGSRLLIEMDVNDFFRCSAGDDGLAGLIGDCGVSLRMSTRRRRAWLSCLRQNGLTCVVVPKHAPSSRGIPAQYSFAPHHSSSQPFGKLNTGSASPRQRPRGFVVLEHAPSSRGIPAVFHSPPGERATFLCVAKETWPKERPPRHSGLQASCLPTAHRDSGGSPTVHPWTDVELGAIHCAHPAGYPCVTLPLHRGPFYCASCAAKTKQIRKVRSSS